MAPMNYEKYHAFKPRLVKEDDMYGKEGYALHLLKPNIYQFQSKGAGSHVYLVIGDNFKVMIDTGIVTRFNSLNYLLTTEIGITIEDINWIINTHEHFDHISTNCYFSCPIAAHRASAVKIKSADELITKAKLHSVNMDAFKVDIWLENDVVFDIGNMALKVIYTPGHTSGSICLYEPTKHVIFTGDTLFKSGASNIYESGSVAELIASLKLLNSLRIRNVYPGHGVCLFDEQEVRSEIEGSIEAAEKSLKGFVDRIKSKSVEKARPPPSLYDRPGSELESE